MDFLQITRDDIKDLIQLIDKLKNAVDSVLLENDTHTSLMALMCTIVESMCQQLGSDEEIEKYKQLFLQLFDFYKTSLHKKPK